MFVNPDAATRRELLSQVRTIAVVGLSPDPGRPSHHVARGLQSRGYRIIPVRPGGGEILGEKVVERLEELPEAVDLVDVFRSSEHVPAIVDVCIALRLPRLWLQDGVVSPQAAERARAAGIQVVMDRCIWRDRLTLLG